MKNKYILSDIHGCTKTFESLLKNINFSREDELFILGDYINRGSNSKQVIDLIMKMESLKYNIVLKTPKILFK